MSNSRDIPVLLFAFSTQDEDIGVQEEADGIEQALGSVTDGETRLCKTLIPRFARSKDIVDVFQRERNRLSIFHYAGHADGAQLLLESAIGNGAGAAGLAASVRGQAGLKLVFLNGCCTEGQVNLWLAAGVPCVIATTRAINGQVARSFAARFYKGLASGVSIKQSYEDAVNEAVTNVNGKTRLLFEDDEEEEQQFDDSRWPWFMKVAPGCEAVQEWNLPDAAGDPLAMLPLPKGMGIPEGSPYPGLKRFTEKEAAVFFGRGQAVRMLYERVTTGVGKIILLHGQSGVGKSSILGAGLIPRLQTKYPGRPCYNVEIIRINPTEKLTTSLHQAFQKFEQSNESGLNLNSLSSAQTWKKIEETTGKPLLIILDQVEEVFTHAGTGGDADWDSFVSELNQIFNVPKNCPEGKLLLCFRNEWAYQIDKKLTGLSRSEVFLDQLDEAGIQEATIGPTLRHDLKEFFPLTIQDGVANKISNDLLDDTASSVAPTLQVLLKRLWDEAVDENRMAPLFDLDLYGKHKATIGKFVRDRVREIQQNEDGTLSAAAKKAIDAGLLIDFLECHVTGEMTSRQRTLKEFVGDPDAAPPIPSMYPGREEVIKELRMHCINKYLLIQPDFEGNAVPEPASRLAHDSLAIHIHKLYEDSDDPGQRARRILEQRTREWDRQEAENKNKETSPSEDHASFNVATLLSNLKSMRHSRDSLSIMALEVIRQGKQGMREWTPQEKKVIAESRQVRMRNLLTLAATAFICLAGFLFYRYRIYTEVIVDRLDCVPQEFHELESYVLDSPRIARWEASAGFQNPTKPIVKLRSAMVLAILDRAKLEHYERILDELRTLDQQSEREEYQNLKHVLTYHDSWNQWESLANELLPNDDLAEGKIQTLVATETKPQQEEEPHYPSVMALFLDAGHPEKIPRSWYAPSVDPTIRTECLLKLHYWVTEDELAKLIGIEKLTPDEDEADRTQPVALKDAEKTAQLKSTLCLALSRYSNTELKEVIDLKKVIRLHRSANNSILHAATRTLLTKMGAYPNVITELKTQTKSPFQIVASDTSNRKAPSWVTMQFQSKKLPPVLLDFVKVTNADQSIFWISTTEVPLLMLQGFQKEFDSYENGEHSEMGLCSNSKYRINSLREMKEAEPAVCITWNEALNFCNWLSYLSKQPQCYTINGEISEFNPDTFINREKHTKTNGGFRLPTPEEWVYACNGPAKTKYHFGNHHYRKDFKYLDEFDWYSGNSVQEYTDNVSDEIRIDQIDYLQKECAQKLPNSWGLFDMHGNVREWVWNRKLTDPKAQELRGGSFKNLPHHCVTTDDTPNTQVNSPIVEYGLRLVIDKLPK